MIICLPTKEGARFRWPLLILGLLPQAIRLVSFQNISWMEFFCLRFFFDLLLVEAIFFHVLFAITGLLIYPRMVRALTVDDLAQGILKNMDYYERVLKVPRRLEDRLIIESWKSMVVLYSPRLIIFLPPPSTLTHGCSTAHRIHGHHSSPSSLLIAPNIASAVPSKYQQKSTFLTNAQ